MKKVLFSIFFFSLMVVGVQAQQSSCSKSCTAKPAAASATCTGKSGSASTANATDTNAAAAKLASMDPSIETRTCPVSGTVSYVRKEASSDNNNVSYVDVAYDPASNSFVNVSPVKMEGEHSCSGKGMKANGKGCCAASASGSKSCCAGKGKAMKTSAPAKN